MRLAFFAIVRGDEYEGKYAREDGEGGGGKMSGRGCDNTGSSNL